MKDATVAIVTYKAPSNRLRLIRRNQLVSPGNEV